MLYLIHFECNSFGTQNKFTVCKEVIHVVEGWLLEVPLYPTEIQTEITAANTNSLILVSNKKQL